MSAGCKLTLIDLGQRPVLEIRSNWICISLPPQRDMWVKGSVHEARGEWTVNIVHCTSSFCNEMEKYLLNDRFFPPTFSSHLSDAFLDMLFLTHLHPSENIFKLE